MIMGLGIIRQRYLAGSLMQYWKDFSVGWTLVLRDMCVSGSAVPSSSTRFRGNSRGI